MMNTRELQEATRDWDEFYRETGRRQLSRRKVFRVGAAASLIAAGGWSAFLAACGGDDDEADDGGTPAATGTVAATGTAAPTEVAEREGITGDWDTTGTPPYKQGLPDGVAEVDPEWQAYPWVYKYGPWRYDWEAAPVTRGGQIIVPFGPPANYDVMISGISSNPSMNKLYNAGLREGLEPLTASIEPDLAIGEEHNADFTEWTFKIPAGVKFHDVEPVNNRLLTGADVVFSFERHIDTNLNRAVLLNVDSVTAPDDETIVFKLKQPAGQFNRVLASPHLPVFAPEVFEDQDLFKSKAIGTGAFITEFSELENRADYVRNPDYWQTHLLGGKYGTQPLPMVDTWTRQFFANNIAAKEAFFAGQVDTFQPGCGVDPVLIAEQVERVPNAILTANAYWSCCPLTFIFNFKNPLFQDKRVRQALSMGMDREQIYRQGMQGTGALGATPIPFDYMMTEKGLPIPLDEFGENVQFNPQRAKALLEEAGFTEPLDIQIYQTGNQPAAWQGAIDTVVFNWKQAGIANAQLVVRDRAVYGEDQRNGTWPDLLYQVGTLAFGYTFDAAVTPAFLSGSPRNFGSLNDEVLDGIFEKWAATVDPVEAAGVAREASDRFVENADTLTFAYIGGMEVTREWMGGGVISVHNCINGIGWSNMKYPWITPDAPDGRGGTPI